MARWLKDPELLEKMKVAALRVARPKASYDIAREISGMLFLDEEDALENDYVMVNGSAEVNWSGMGRHMDVNLPSGDILSFLSFENDSDGRVLGIESSLFAHFLKLIIFSRRQFSTTRKRDVVGERVQASPLYSDRLLA